MAEDLTPAPGAPQPAVGAGRHPKAGRFNLLKAAIAAVAFLIILIGSSFLAGSGELPGSKGGWSTWAPSATGLEAAEEIAAHVAPQYKGADGKQLVAVSGGEIKVANLPVKIAIRDPKGDGSIEMVNGSGFLYTLCGMGPNCSIEKGKPSVERMLLLRREALELALYSFKADSSIDNVVVLMPPRPGVRNVKMEDGSMAQVGNQGAGLLFQRDQLTAELDGKLADTVPEQVPTIATMTSAPEAGLVERITDPSMFMVSVKQGQDGSAFLVLDRMG